MASWPASARAKWLILAVLHAEATSAAWFRDRSCMSGVVSIPASQRRNVTVDGIAGPLRIAHGEWESASLIAWTSKVICEEVLGLYVDLLPLPSSPRLLYTVSDCKDPLNEVDKKCDHPGPPPAHVAVGVWHTVDGDALLASVKANHPGKYPLDLGSVGYTGQSGFFLQEASVEPAMRQHHLLLQYYLSYSHPQVDVPAYFSRVHEISTADLTPCNETRLRSNLVGDVYMEQTGDTASIDRATGGILCSDGYWWLSPDCRRNSSACIPFLTGGDGWEVLVAMQRATVWSIPLAVAIATDAGYAMLPKQFRTITYWWFPDATFLSTNPVWMSFPRFDPEEWKSGRTTTDFAPDQISKYAFRGMENRSNVGTERALQFLRNLQYSYPQISALLSLYVSKPAGDAALEETVCEWMNNNSAVWEYWIPVETNCMKGQGLIDEQQAFVENRTAAQGCTWCLPGRISMELMDAVGTTYRCQECNVGRFQGTIGMTECERCSPGTSATRPGMAACDRCDFSEFAAEAGASQCQVCPQGFITAFQGAQSIDACLCPEGTYRGAANRDACLPCKFGMHCPVGSDALGYLPEHAAAYQVVPLLEKGFWSSASEPLSIFRCEDIARCPGRRAPANACFDRLEGQACQHCSEGYVWGGDTCRECKYQVVGYIIFPVLPCIGLPLLVILLYMTSSDGFEKWGTWQAGIGALFFLLLHHSQLMQVIHRTDTAFTKPASSALSTFEWVSDIWSIFSMGCHGFHTFSKMMLLQGLGPFFLIAGYALVWCASQLVGVLYPPVKMDINRTICGLLSLLVSFFTAIADSAMTIFKCSKNPNNTHSLVSDRSVLCFEGEWNGLVAAGISSVLVWCVGVILLFLHAIWTAGAQMHREAFRARWKFLFIRYRNDVHWWALVIMIKGIVVNLGCVVMENGIGQIVWILVAFLLYTHLTSRYRPWRCVLNNIADVDLHFSLTLACAATVWFAKDERVAIIPDGTLWSENLVKAATYAPPALFAPFALAIWWFNGSQRAQEKKRQHLQVVAESVERLASLSGVNLESFLSSLSEPDWLATVTFTSVVHTELGAPGVRKSRRGYCSNMLGHEQLSNAEEATKEQLDAEEPLNCPTDSVQAGEQASSSDVVVDVAVEGGEEPVAQSELHSARGADAPSLQPALGEALPRSEEQRQPEQPEQPGAQMSSFMADVELLTHRWTRSPQSQ